MSNQSTADWNAVRFAPTQAQGHVESYFLKLNDPQRRRALWLKSTILAESNRASAALAEAWAIFFRDQGEHVAVKRSVPYAQARFSAERLDIKIGDMVEVTSEGTRGDIEYGGHKVSWKLRMEAVGPALVMLPRSMYTTAFPKSKLVSPMPDARFFGSVTVDGETVQVDNWRGMQGHNWGRGHAEQYAWGHCNQWEGDEQELVLEAVSARVRTGPVLTPMLTLVTLRHRGREFEFKGPVEMVRNRAELWPRRWHFVARSSNALVEGDFSAQNSDFVGLYYANPDGSMTYCLNSKLAMARLRLEVAGEPAIDRITHSAAFEIGTKDPDHGIRMYL